MKNHTLLVWLFFSALPNLALSQTPAPKGNEFQVNAQSQYAQSYPSVASAADGSFMVVWDSEYQDGTPLSVFAQRFAADGTAQGEFQVNSYTTGYQYAPSVAMDSDGDFVVAWDSYDQDGDLTGVFAQRFNSDGTLAGGDFQVNSLTTGYQYDASIAMDADGDFVVVWTSYQTDYPPNSEVYGQLYANDGSALGGEFRINSFTTGFQSRPAVVMDADGDFVVVWESFNYGDLEVYAKRYSSGGTPLGGEILVPSSSGLHYDPSISMDGQGNFVVAWAQTDNYGDNVISGRVFANDGTPSGADFQISSSTTTYRDYPSVATESNGKFVVVWQSSGQDGSSAGVFGQRFTSTGMTLGSEFLVNSYTTDAQGVPSVARGADGDFVVAWDSYDQDGDSYGIFAQRFKLDLDTRVVIDSPAENAFLSPPFTVTGSAIDTSAMSGTGVNAVDIWAFPSKGSPSVFLGAATLGINHPGAGTNYGDQYAASGYSLTVTTPLADEIYTLKAYARSTASGNYEGVGEVTVKIGSDPVMWIDQPTSGATVNLPFPISGWAVDRVAPSGTGVDQVKVWAVPHDGSPATYLGAATLGIQRPDIGAYLGDPRFDNSGFHFNVSAPLDPGTYTLYVFARSTMSGAFNVLSVTVTVLQAVTQIWVDRPTDGASVAVPFEVKGWAINVGGSGTGVDMVIVWALPQGGSSHIFLGSATMGLDRPDIGAYFGNPRFDPSGFKLDVTNPLPEGTYTLTVVARSTLTGTFDALREITVTISSDPIMWVDTPSPEATVSPPFKISGWAIDRGASSGTGVDDVKVWAVPQDGSPATYLGAATLGASRPDIGAYFGDSRFDNSGFHYTVTNPLAPGRYTLHVFAHSTVTGTFNNAAAVVVTLSP